MVNTNYRILADYIEIIIFRPLYGTFCYIREKYVQLAQKKNIPLKIVIKGKGFGFHTAEDWMKNSKRMEKVFLRPNEPMVLIGNFVRIDGEKVYEPAEEKKKDQQLPLI